jgi:hypothetical protein
MIWNNSKRKGSMRVSGRVEPMSNSTASYIW